MFRWLGIVAQRFVSDRVAYRAVVTMSEGIAANGERDVRKRRAGDIPLVTRLGVAAWGMLLAVSIATPLTAKSSPAYDRKLQRCMVYIPTIKDTKLREWCLKQSERVP